MKLLMLGTGPFAAPTFRELLCSQHTVVGLVTGPIRQHGHRSAAPNLMREIAAEHGTAIYDPESVNTDPARMELRRFEADLMVVCDFGQILSPETLATARLGGVNLHGSLLPKYRGAAPIHWAIYHGETETGVSVIHMTPKVDAGPVIAQSKTAIAPGETAAELEPRLAELGARLVLDAIGAIESGNAQAVPQDKSLASKAPRIKKTDGLIDWSRPAAAIVNHVRAMQPWPGTYTFWLRQSGPLLRLLVAPPTMVEPSTAETPPGTVVEASGERLLVATGDGTLALDHIQPAGKRLLSVKEFLLGYRVQPGDKFGREDVLENIAASPPSAE